MTNDTMRAGDEPTFRDSVRNLGGLGVAAVVAAFVVVGVGACYNGSVDTVSKMTPIVVEQTEDESCEQPIVDGSPSDVSLD